MSAMLLISLLRAGVAAGEADDVVVAIELAHQLQAVALDHPGRHLPAVQAEGDGAAKGEGLVLAEEVIGRRVRDLDGARLHRINHLQGRHELPAGMHRDLELAAGHLRDLLREHVGRAEDGVQRLRETRCEAPAHLRLRMHDGGGGACSQHTGEAGLAHEGTAFHGHGCLLISGLRREKGRRDSRKAAPPSRPDLPRRRD
jgi:hypothetical protein